MTSRIASAKFVSADMELILYFIARIVLGTLERLPLRMVARIGRGIGGMVHLIDARHRRVARKNLRMCFPEKPEAEICAIARENFKRIGENFCCAVKTSSMGNDEFKDVLEIVGIEKVPLPPPGTKPQNLVVAVGHFGNFEIFARCILLLPQYRLATTYRGLKQKSLNKLILKMRQRSPCQFFERRTDLDALKTSLQEGGLMLGLFSDQYGGVKGLCLPLLGHECSTNVAPALFALRYDCNVMTAICYRVGLGKWRIEVGDLIPTQENGIPRSSEAIMGDVNLAYDAAIRRDPANWFWVHNRWKRDGLWWKKKPVAPTS